MAAEMQGFDPEAEKHERLVGVVGLIMQRLELSPERLDEDNEAYTAFFEEFKATVDREAIDADSMDMLEATDDYTLRWWERGDDDENGGGASVREPRNPVTPLDSLSAG